MCKTSSYRDSDYENLTPTEIRVLENIDWETLDSNTFYG
jgi:hypothetical protein